MEVQQIQCKFPKINNGGYASTIVSQREKMDEDEEEGENRRGNLNNGGAVDPGGGVVGLYGWPSSRIVRVSRATGGKDRHSKVLTSRGLRDRRVRLSVNTAIEFYDLQDRLGYDQPSKAVEWLLAAAANSIAELPPMNSPFPDSNKRPSEVEKADRHMILADPVMDGGGGSINRGGAQQEAAAVKSTVGSSSSENSKGSRPSNSRSENRFRAREKAKERENEKSSYVTSFTELLSGGGINYTKGGGGGGKEASVYRDRRPITDGNSNHQSNFFHRFPMDYFGSGLPGPQETASPAEITTPLLLSAATTDHHPELQPFSFTSDHLVSEVNPSAINRGTLQSNSSSAPSLHLPPNFFGGGAAPAGNHRQFFPGFDARLHLYYGDGEGNDGEHSGPKRKTNPDLGHSQTAG